MERSGLNKEKVILKDQCTSCILCTICVEYTLYILWVCSQNGSLKNTEGSL